MTLQVTQRIGRLTLRKHLPGGKWECICDCGRKVTRLTGDLNRAVRLGHTAHCKRCKPSRDMVSRCLKHDPKRQEPTP